MIELKAMKWLKVQDLKVAGVRKKEARHLSGNEKKKKRGGVKIGRLILSLLFK